MGELTEIAHRWEFVCMMSHLHIVVVGVYILGSSHSFRETLSYKRCARKSWRSLRMLKASETSPQKVFCCQTLGSGLLIQPAVSPPTPFQLFAVFWHLKAAIQGCHQQQQLEILTTQCGFMSFLANVPLSVPGRTGLNDAEFAQE